MRLYHWKFNCDGRTCDFLVMSESLDRARSVITENLKGWRFQKPAIFDGFLEQITGPPLYQAEADHVIMVGM